MRKFKVGDKVRLIIGFDSTPIPLKPLIGDILTVLSVIGDDSWIRVTKEHSHYHDSLFELIGNWEKIEI